MMCYPATVMFTFATLMLITAVHAGKQSEGGCNSSNIRGGGGSSGIGGGGGTNVQRLIQWPMGSYTLPKSLVGCPSGWIEGWGKQDNDDHNRKYVFRDGNNFFGSFGKNTVLNVCTKDDTILHTSINWPKGNYCIIRSTTSCHPGFHTCFMKWDDGDRRNDKEWGPLPITIDNRKTLIHFCCRSDGRASTPIELPTNKPFYLLRYQQPCQQVKDMVVREESLTTDDENNKNSKGGIHSFLVNMSTHSNIVIITNK